MDFEIGKMIKKDKAKAKEIVLNKEVPEKKNITSNNLIAA